MNIFIEYEVKTVDISYTEKQLNFIIEEMLAGHKYRLEMMDGKRAVSIWNANFVMCDLQEHNETTKTHREEYFRGDTDFLLLKEFGKGDTIRTKHGETVIANRVLDLEKNEITYFCKSIRHVNRLNTRDEFKERFCNAYNEAQSMIQKKKKRKPFFKLFV